MQDINIRAIKMLSETHEIEKVKAALSNLLGELATELDLHYDDGDFFALTPTITVMKDASEVLVKVLGGEPPAVLDHVFARYNKSRN